MTDPLSSATPLCVFRLRSGWLAIAAPLVGEVADLEAPTPLPGCRPGVLGLANLRGRAVAAIDLDHVLGATSAREATTPTATGGSIRCLVLRLPGREAAAAIERVEGVFAADPAGRRAVNREAEPAWIAGFHAFPGLLTETGSELVAAVIDPDELGRRLDALRFTPTATAITQRQGT